MFNGCFCPHLFKGRFLGFFVTHQDCEEQANGENANIWGYLGNSLPLLHVIAARANLSYFFLTFLCSFGAYLGTSGGGKQLLLLVSDEDSFSGHRKLEFKVQFNHLEKLLQAEH